MDETWTLKVLDTDTLIAILRGNAAVRLRQEQVATSLATTIISLAELSYGAAKSRFPQPEQARVAALLRSMEVLDLTREAARTFGDLKALLERQGRKLPDADLFIAAICLEHGATIVTGNRRHFDRIPGLAIENWIDGSDA